MVKSYDISIFVPTYAMTICKAQGQTLNYVVLWFDVPVLPPGTAYVALSRVRRHNSLSFLTRVFSQEFVPVPRTDAASQRHIAHQSFC